ncbi:chalcone isomerase [Tanacetum coccineum]
MLVGNSVAVAPFSSSDITTVDKFHEVLKDEHFPPGNSILFTSSQLVQCIAEDAIVVLENEKWGQIVMEMSIGKAAPFPPAKQSLASRLADFMN